VDLPVLQEGKASPRSLVAGMGWGRAWGLHVPGQSTWS
jgi:hypothetical protein